MDSGHKTIKIIYIIIGHYLPIILKQSSIYKNGEQKVQGKKLPIFYPNLNSGFFS